MICETEATNRPVVFTFNKRSQESSIRSGQWTSPGYPPGSRCYSVGSGALSRSRWPFGSTGQPGITSRRCRWRSRQHRVQMKVEHADPACALRWIAPDEWVDWMAGAVIGDVHGKAHAVVGHGGKYDIRVVASAMKGPVLCRPGTLARASFSAGASCRHAGAYHTLHQSPRIGRHVFSRLCQALCGHCGPPCRGFAKS